VNVNGPIAAAEDKVIRFGGEPPWGLEKPVHISGKVRRHESFKQPIGRGLDFRLEPTEGGWEIMVSDANGADLMERSYWEPCHGGPYDTDKYLNIDKRHVGDTRELNFDLTAARTAKRSKEYYDLCASVHRPDEDDRYLTPSQYRAWLRESRTRPGLDTEGGGAGTLVITGLTPGPQPLDVTLDFEADLVFTGALELWKLRSRFIIPKGYRGFVYVYDNDPGAPPSPKSGDFYLLRIPASGILHTSSKLRDISGDEQYIFSDGLTLSVYGLRRPILISPRARPQSFFVGTDRQYELAEEH
jgi:hypothetical protein